VSNIENERYFVDWFREWWDSKKPFGYDHSETREPIHNMFKYSDNMIHDRNCKIENQQSKIDELEAENELLRFRVGFYKNASTDDILDYHNENAKLKASNKKLRRIKTDYKEFLGFIIDNNASGDVVGCANFHNERLIKWLKEIGDE